MTTLPSGSVAPSEFGWTRGVPPNWTDGLKKVVAESISDHVTHVSGPCPRCHHGLWTDVGPEIAIGLTPEGIEFLLYCNCAEPHEGRPETETAGCGAYGRVVIPR